MRDKRLSKLATNIKAERHRKGLTQDDLSEKVNISTRSLSSIENGYQTPSIFIVYDIAKVLEIDINELLKSF